MTISVDQLFESVNLDFEGPVKWGEPFDANYNGVYIITLASDSSSKKPLNKSLKIDEKIFNDWIVEAKNLKINGIKVSNFEQLNEYLEQFWKKDQNILYIGESTSKTNPIQKRVKQFYQHKVGKKGPHSGGYWLKLISNLNEVRIYFAKCANPREIEFKLIMKFVELQAEKSFFEIDDFSKYFPFANLKVDVLKEHGITKPTNDNKK